VAGEIIYLKNGGQVFKKGAVRQNDNVARTSNRRIFIFSNFDRSKLQLFALLSKLFASRSERKKNFKFLPGDFFSRLPQFQPPKALTCPKGYHFNRLLPFFHLTALN
jgi:hypothetical protein